MYVSVCPSLPVCPAVCLLPRWQSLSVSIPSSAISARSLSRRPPSFSLFSPTVLAESGGAKFLGYADIDKAPEGKGARQLEKTSSEESCSQAPVRLSPFLSHVLPLHPLFPFFFLSHHCAVLCLALSLRKQSIRGITLCFPFILFRFVSPSATVLCAFSLHRGLTWCSPFVSFPATVLCALPLREQSVSAVSQFLRRTLSTRRPTGTTPTSTVLDTLTTLRT